MSDARAVSHHLVAPSGDSILGSHMKAWHLVITDAPHINLVSKAIILNRIREGNPDGISQSKLKSIQYLLRQGVNSPNILISVLENKLFFWVVKKLSRYKCTARDVHQVIRFAFHRDFLVELNRAINFYRHERKKISALIYRLTHSGAMLTALLYLRSLEAKERYLLLTTALGSEQIILKLAAFRFTWTPLTLKRFLTSNPVQYAFGALLFSSNLDTSGLLFHINRALNSDRYAAFIYFRFAYWKPKKLPDGISMGAPLLSFIHKHVNNKKKLKDLHEALQYGLFIRTPFSQLFLVSNTSQVNLLLAMKDKNNRSQPLIKFIIHQPKTANLLDKKAQDYLPEIMEAISILFKKGFKAKHILKFMPLTQQQVDFIIELNHHKKIGLKNYCEVVKHTYLAEIMSQDLQLSIKSKFTLYWHLERIKARAALSLMPTSKTVAQIMLTFFNWGQLDINHARAISRLSYYNKRAHRHAVHALNSPAIFDVCLSTRKLDVEEMEITLV